ncbi:MAG: dockerin type I domain-containing protein [Planctomycetia bacterium]|nr:dockerin type I domain-containing protein [Planctomycetia bacterium]
MRRLCLLLATSLFVLSLAAPSWAVAPWDVNMPIVTVQKELYQPVPAPGTVLWCWASYIGPNLREENYVEESAATGDDFHMNPRRRYSSDNGLTWTEMIPQDPITFYIDGTRVQFRRLERAFVDPVTNATIRTSQYVVHNYAGYGQQVHMFYRLSLDGGQTYAEPEQLRYEDLGDPYDIAHPLNENALRYNQADLGNNIIRHSNGTVVMAAGGVMIPYEQGGQTTPMPIGSLCMIGSWNPTNQDYDWQAGAPTHISTASSPRGLMEPEVAELTDHRLMITWRTDMGRRYYGLSTDGGQTIGEPTELKYNDGTQFYSPSSISHMFRSSETGKLYFLGNITMDAPSGNSPRYPLVIAEIDETGVPSIKKDTVTMIDTRQPGEASTIQFSNFSFLENKETRQLEMYVSPLGVNPNSLYEAPVRKYTLTLIADETIRPIYREIFPNTTGSPVGLNTCGWIAHGGANAALVGKLNGTDAVNVAGSDGAPPQPAINSNAATTDTVSGYTFHTTSMVPAGQPQIVWTSEYVVDEAWDLTEVRWEQLLNNASLTPSFAVQVGTNWFVTDQTGTIESTDPLFDVVSLDLTTATWSALDFRHGQALTVGAPVAALPEGDITAFGLFIEQNPADAFLRFDNITLLARKAAAIPGDANHDGAVNDLDASILGAHWRKSSGATWEEGDFTRDGAVDDRDAAILAAHWGAGAAESSVPEPGTLALLAPAVLMLLFSPMGHPLSSKMLHLFFNRWEVQR